MAGAQVFRRNLRVYADQNLSPAARSARLAATAKAELAKLRAAGRIPAAAAVSRFVDGRPGAPEETVRGDGRGVILYEFSYTAEAAAFALAYLIRRTRVMADYSRSFWVGVNGTPVSAASFDPLRVTPGAEIAIINKQPYNRLADAQRAGTKRVTFPVPPDLYNDCAAAVRRRFGNAVTAKRVYNLNFPGKYLLRRTTARRSAGTPVESPALVINDRR